MSIFPCLPGDREPLPPTCTPKARCLWSTVWWEAKACGHTVTGAAAVASFQLEMLRVCSLCCGMWCWSCSHDVPSGQLPVSAPPASLCVHAHTPAFNPALKWLPITGESPPEPGLRLGALVQISCRISSSPDKRTRLFAPLSSCGLRGGAVGWAPCNLDWHPWLLTEILGRSGGSFCAPGTARAGLPSTRSG